MPKAFHRLSIELQAKLFSQLQQLESAGLPAAQAAKIVSRTESALQKPLTLMFRQLSTGSSVSEAGFKAGLFDPLQQTLVQAGELSGRLDEVYGQLAEYYTRLNNQIKKVKSRCYLPALMLTLGLFIQPLPALIGSQISLLTYVTSSLGSLLAIAFGLMLLIKLPGMIRTLGFESDWHRLQLRIPVVAAWLRKRQLNHFFFILSIMLESGIAFNDALPKAVANIKNACLRERFRPALAALSSGASAHEILSKVTLIPPRQLSIINSSEQSGKLAGGIGHMVQLEAETIRLQNESLADWLPRLIYTVIALWLAASILSSQIGTPLPTSI